MLPGIVLSPYLSLPLFFPLSFPLLLSTAWWSQGRWTFRHDSWLTLSKYSKRKYSKRHKVEGDNLTRYQPGN